MFFIFAVLSMVAYALHSTWLAPYYRRHDRLAMVTVRGAGLSLLMLPGLWMAGPIELGAVAAQWNWILVTSGITLVGNWASANTLRYLPIGIATALNMSLSTLVSVLISAYVLGESLSGRQVVWMGLIVCGVLGLGAVRNPPLATVTYSLPRGLAFAATFGVTLGIGFTLIGRISREIDPLVAGWCWESTITAMGAVVLAARRLALGSVGSLPLWRELGWILAMCIPGAAGTSFYALAVAVGPVAIVTAVLGSMMVAVSVLAWLIHGERLSAGQWIFIAFVCCAIVGMRYASV